MRVRISISRRFLGIIFFLIIHICLAKEWGITLLGLDSLLNILECKQKILNILLVLY